MSKKVLLIDYEPRSVERVRSLLQAPDYALTVAKDGEEGISTFSSSPFDAVVLAGMLPRLPSAEVIREIRRKGGAGAPPILLMVSGYHGNNPKADAQRVGAFDIVPRPFTDEALRAALQDAIASSDVGARTMRIATASFQGSGNLTSEEIFSDVLLDVGDETPLPATAVPVPPPAPPASPHAESDVERRLRDTLSGLLGKPGTGAPRAGAASAHAAAATRYSTDADIDRMISDTLSGIKTPSRARQSPRSGQTASAVETASHTPTGLTPTGLTPTGLTPTSWAPTAGTPTAPGAEARTATRAADPVPSHVSSGPDRFGQYEILERIAAGGMAELSRARLSGVEGFEKIVAIKKILPHLADNDEFITMFADEAKLAAQLNHPNIVHIFDLGKIEAGGYFIAMEYVEGRDLRSLLQSAKELGAPLPTPLAVYVAAKIAAALDYAHRRRDAEGRELNIVHRDVSPPNILISYEGDIKLCDFGIAKAASKASTTQSGALKGKVQYMSPEQAWGRPIDRRSDVFSLGCVLFEMLTEEKLFRGETDLSLLEKVRAAQVVPPSTMNPDVPRTLDAVVLKALAKEPEDRYANASDMLRDLEAVLYSYSPAPGSADLAIYLHRLQAEETNAQESSARAAASSAPREPEKKRKSKGAPVQRRGGTAPKLVVPHSTVPASSVSAAAAKTPRRDSKEAGVYGAFPPSQKIEAERKSRIPLYASIGAAVLVLAAVGWWVSRRSAPVALPVRPAPATAVPAAVPTVAPAPASVVPPAPGMDARAIEDEVQRQIAARKKELQKALEAPKSAKEAAVAPVPLVKKEELAAPTAIPVKEAAPEPASVKTEPPPPEPTLAPPPVRSVPPPARAEVREEVTRGELVGPGAGVIEPSLVSTPRISYPSIARQQRVGGKVVVLVLVDEEGRVVEVRLEQGISSRNGVNEAVVLGVKNARFRAATKNGIPVKMWRTVVVDVNP